MNPPDLSEIALKNRYIPLAAHSSKTSTLFIDSHACAEDLQDCATSRIQAATDLLESLSCMSINNTCDRDLSRFAGAAYLLLRDGLDLLEVRRSVKPG
ncbi:MAG TPA: hypothetical protein VGC62_09720 [Pseudomonas sp.]|uniref:hypothetical protein n=1 Tax=Pseudomonas sp. TaxID=306 RepID=UPI002EDB484E